MVRYENALDYLVKSLDYILEQHKSCLATKREATKEMELLKADMDKISNPRLKEAALKTFNHFSMEKTKHTNLLKDINEDEKYIREIMKVYRRAIRK